MELLKSVLPNFQNNMAYWGEKPIYEFADCLLANGVTVEMKTIHKPDKPISTEIIDFIDWFSVEAPSEYEKGVVTGLRIAETIAEVIERNCEERSV